MSSTLTLAIRWTNGTSVIVKVDSTMPAGSITEHPCLCRLASRDDLIIHKAQILSPYLSLASQGVSDGDTIVIYPRILPDSTEVEERSSGQTQIRSILREVTKLNDSFFHSLETDPRGGWLLWRCHAASSASVPFDDFPFPIDETVIPTENCLSTDPLPPLELDEPSDNEYSDDEDWPQFENFKQAGQFFSKLPWNNWKW
jgi:hypothetical protein